MDLRQAMQFSALQQKPKSGGEPQKLSATQIARKIFAMAAAEGHPFQKISARQWKDKWLASDEFVRVEIQTGKVALPGLPRDTNKVLANVQASAGSLEPIVVDLNKRKIGASLTGYVPKVIVVEGKHRHVARTLQGHGKIEAWVGIRAIDHVMASMAVIQASEPPKLQVTRLEAAAILNVPRQDVAQNGSAPKQPIPSAFPTKGNGNLDNPSTPFAQRWPRKTGVSATGGGPAGSSLGSGGSSNPDRMGMAAVQVDPGDVGQSQDPTDIQQSYSPGSGNGPRLKPNKGASKSEMASKAITVKKIVTKRPKKMAAVAPPGREAQVLKLKKKFGEDSAVPFKIAWSQRNK